jgi:hypothetical protein
MNFAIRKYKDNLKMRSTSIRSIARHKRWSLLLHGLFTKESSYDGLQKTQEQDEENQ